MNAHQVEGTLIFAAVPSTQCGALPTCRTVVDAANVAIGGGFGSRTRFTRGAGRPAGEPSPPRREFLASTASGGR